nr:hypothetical protein [Rhodococcus wratislaviensis]GLK33815.1 hypothetical protein GCM10017611_06580 [Rhodococcus wratislaviensis]
MSTTLIRNGHLLTMDPTHGEIARAYALIDGTRISQIGVDLDTTAVDTVIDAADHLVAPGFVDARTGTCGKRSCGVGWRTRHWSTMPPSSEVYTALATNPRTSISPILTGYLDALGCRYDHPYRPLPQHELGRTQAAPLHDRLIRYLIKRTRIDG